MWPVGEPFRITDPDVLRAAATLVAATVDRGSPTVADPLGTAFDALLAGRYDHAGGLGTYLTPSGVARMMAEIAVELVEVPRAPAGPGFGDPYCGTGRFIVALLEVLRERDDPAARRLRTAGLVRRRPVDRGRGQGPDQHAPLRCAPSAGVDGPRLGDRLRCGHVSPAGCR